MDAPNGFVDLAIHFIGASGLPKMDVIGTADPYFVAKLDSALTFVCVGQFMRVYDAQILLQVLCEAKYHGSRVERILENQERSYLRKAPY